MNCFICKDYTYKEKYNIDIDKKNTNIYEVLEIKYNSINENTYINTFSENNYEKDFQIIEYPEKKNKGTFLIIKKWDVYVQDQI